MQDLTVLYAVLGGIILLLVLILYFKVHAFLALFISSFAVGVFAGMPPGEIILSLKKGMGETLSAIAAVVGLGAMFGAILEHSGGAQSLANYLLKRTGEKNASWAMMLTGFFVAIPVFFDVAFIILIPMVYALQKKSGKPLLFYGIPLLAGLAITHTFIPPTPGPVLVAEFIGADLGWVILIGFVTGIPAAILAGPIFGKYISARISCKPVSYTEPELQEGNTPSAAMIFSIIGIPIALIIINSFLNSPLSADWGISAGTQEWLKMIGHPFSALIIANLIAWYLLGIRRGMTKDKLFKITGNSLAPAGVIILITGAGGMFKEVLTQAGAGSMLAGAMTSIGGSYILLGFLIAAIVRILQGSATVAMATSASLTSSIMVAGPIGDLEKALIVISIASGATILSHVNDSGFWLVSRYFGLNEKQTLASWSVMTTIIAVSGLVTVLLISFFFV